MLPYNTGTVRVTSAYLENRSGTPHKGIDLVGTNKLIVAVLPGVVLLSRRITDPSNRTSEWGEYVCVRSGDGTLSYYCHLSERRVKSGDTIRAGDTIGVEGSTGKSTGSHLHFEVRNAAGVSVDPTPYLGTPNARGSYVIPDYAGLVCEKAGLGVQTREYLDKYKYKDDLWRKLWEAMEE